MLTPLQAKRIIAAALNERDLFFDHITARTVSFVDLARAKMIFVTIHGWRKDPRWEELDAIARAHGFRIETR